jgi:UDP-N-acetylglucosamine--N-acetylmuramyl-(pentapeptide) pyrophosphoryl-undecaprenol N-acetylglucosamine transferase
MVASTRRASALLSVLRPQVVVSVGGYASVPAVLAARRHRVPVVVVSYDRTPGLASRLAARWAAACAVSFDGSKLPRAELTGAPVRQQILDVDRSADRGDARRRLGLPEDRFVVSVMGGSLGSGVLNHAVQSFLAAHADDAELAVHHVAGTRFVDDVAVVAARSGDIGVLHQVVGFEPDMAAVYAASDLVVGRGGASTVHEVAATGTPAILVPWSGAADDHQTDNVRWLSEIGGAVLLTEPDLDQLGDWIERLRHDGDQRQRLGAAAAGRGEVHRSGALGMLIERVATRSSLTEL